MISSFEAGIRIEQPFNPNAIQCLTATTFGGRRISWREMAEVYSVNLGFYVCLVLLDQSVASKDVSNAIQERYVELDRVTGDDLLVLSTVPPPKGWFRHQINRLGRLPDWAGKFQQNEIYILGSESGQNDAHLNCQTLLDDFFDSDLRPPLVVFVHPYPEGPDSKEFELRAKGFDISGFGNGSKIVMAFEYLAKVARGKKAIGASALDVGDEAFSMKPFSLLWRNATFKTYKTLEFVEEWIKRARALGFE